MRTIDPAVLAGYDAGIERNRLRSGHLPVFHNDFAIWRASSSVFFLMIIGLCSPLTILNR